MGLGGVACCPLRRRMILVDVVAENVKPRSRRELLERSFAHQFANSERLDHLDGRGFG